MPRERRGALLRPDLPPEPAAYAQQRLGFTHRRHFQSRLDPTFIAERLELEI